MSRLSSAGTAIFAALAVAALSAGEVSAQSVPLGWTPERESVEHADLDLGSRAGAERLLLRVRQSAERVCGLRDSRRRGATLRQRTLARACVNQAMSQAVTGVESAHVQAAYADGGYRAGQYPGAASVTHHGEAFRIVIPHEGYDLTSDAGRRSVSRSMLQAARRACNTGLIVSRAERDCIRAALESGETQIAAAAQTQQAASAAPAAAPPALTAGDTTASRVDLESAATGFGICEPRALSTAFARSSAALTHSGRAELGNAVDRASVCRLEAAIVSVDGAGALARRRAEALRAALVARGVPVQNIQIELGAPITAPEVRLTFSGVASGETETLAMAAPDA